MSASAPGPASGSLPTPDSQAVTSGGRFLVLLLRFFVGYGVLFACALLLLRQPAWTLSAVDAVFWGALVLAVVLQRAAARNAHEVAQWPRAALKHVAVAGVLWVACQSVHAIP